MVQKRAKEAKAEKQAVAKKDRTSWLSLIDAGVLQPGEELELIKLPKALLLQVPAEARLAQLLVAPKGQVRWLKDGQVDSISRLCAVICAEFAPGTIPPKYPFDGPAYWAQRGTKVTLADLARNLPAEETPGL
ncbi:hypothetical protein [Hymenobacter ruricola]|uniref:Uncharacterized protein n=1 Tax=Hymenobacter ruricola TaxID=2791023 RepID=A0ABS0IBN5_9BACT|nr:hypothetical protein [Hymenobacter ruricola]MBF9224329.1 hypothetical protein [Hymenobacter ruricola]